MLTLKFSTRLRATGLLLFFLPGFVQAQGRMVLNGASVTITNGATLVMANSATNAITRNSGRIISEGENNRIKWNIGTTTGTYSIPWGTAAGSYLPVSFTPNSASGSSGYFYFSTYPTSSTNSTSLPAGVSNFNNAVGSDASLTAIDRFWRIEPLAYTTPPSLSNLVFTYLDTEFATPNKTAVENKLTARRWNSSLQTWQDYITSGTVNTTTNTITITSLPAAQLYPWWSVQYPGSAFHWVAASTGNFNQSSNWAATTGGPGGIGVPSFGDAVYFEDNADGNCTVNTEIDVAQLSVGTGYTGTITQGTNNIAVDGDATFSSGSFTGGSASMTVNGNLIIANTFAAPSGVLDIKKNFTVTGSGVFSHQNGTLRFSGTTGTQTITASNAVFRSIDVTNSSASPGLIWESNSQITGVLTLGTNVSVDPDGAADNRIVTLTSSADNPTRDAAIGILPAGASVNGKVTVQRYMTIEGASGGRIYRYIASPLTAATVADIQNEIPVTGTFTGASSCTGCTTSSQSMFAYDESILVDTNGNGISNYDDGYIDFPKDTNLETLVPGRGYALYVRGNLLSTARWDVRGNINAANIAPIALPVSYTSSGTAANDGWNLVGNPFPSTIDWNASTGWTKSNVGSAIYIRDNAVAGGQYATWNGVVGTNGGSRYIAIGQAFWVKATAASPVINVTENVKASGVQTTFFREVAPTNIMRITLRQGANRDEAIIHLRADATDNFDEQADALKLLNAGFSLSTQLAGKEKMAINSLNAFACSTTVSLLMDNIAKGDYSFSFEEINSFPEETILELKDNFTGTSINLRNINTYAFSVTTDASSSSPTRFIIQVTQSMVPMDYQPLNARACEGSDASITIENTSVLNRYELLMNGHALETVDGMDEQLTLNIPKEWLMSGTNTAIVRATPLNGCGSSMEKAVSINVEPLNTPQTVTPGFACKQGSVALTALGAKAGQSYRWYTSDTDEHALSSDSVFITPVLEESQQYYVAIANSLGCEGNRVPVAADVIHYDQPVITQQHDSLWVDFPGVKQWYLDGDLLPGETNASIKPVRAGMYTVEIVVQSCVASASYFIDNILDVVGETGTSKLNLYPNPVTRYLYFQDSHSEVRELWVQDITGKIMGKFLITKSGNITTARVDMSAISPGVYIVHAVHRDGRSQEMKIIKE